MKIEVNYKETKRPVESISIELSHNEAGALRDVLRHVHKRNFSILTGLSFTLLNRLEELEL